MQTKKGATDSHTEADANEACGGSIEAGGKKEAIKRMYTMPNGGVHSAQHISGLSHIEDMMK